MPAASSNGGNGARETPSAEAFDRRLPIYAYLEPLFAGRRVLEIGCGSGAGADYLAARGAARVLSIDVDAVAIDRARARVRRANLELRAVSSLATLSELGERFDVILAPDAGALLGRATGEGLGADPVLAWKRALAEGGRLVISVASADRRGGGGGGGLGYYELSDALLPHFARVQMFGVTPFAGFGVVEFDAGADGLRVDSRLVEEEAETPSAYLALAAAEGTDGLGYALVQVPFGPIETRLAARAESEQRGTDARLAASERRLDDAERRARARVEEAEGRIAELRRKLDDASVQSESAVRIARAQGEEIEELRGRLRRAAEDRGALDGETAKLRRALADADESVMTLTRRTAEEMSAVAQRLSAGLRAPAPVPEPELRERDRRERDRDRGAEVSAARDEAERLRAALAESEARAGAAEQRLEEIATDARERKAALEDALERLRLSEDAIARERREVARLQGQSRGAATAARALEQKDAELAGRDDRIARLEGDKQDLTWRLAELEEKLREAIARAVVSDAGRGVAAAGAAAAPAEELTAARAGRERALEEFRRAAAAHVDEVTQLRASVSEQTALVTELEDAVAGAEARAAAATAEAAAAKKAAKSLEEADRTRRSRLAELEGKLLRLEHERKQAAAAAPPPARSAEDQGALAAQAARLAELGRERDELRAAVERGQGRVATLEAEVARLGAQPPAPRNGHDHDREARDVAALAHELDGIEAGLRQEMGTLADIESALADQVASVNAEAASYASGGAGAGGGAGDTAGATVTDVGLLRATLSSYQRRAGQLRDELTGIRRRWESLSPSEISGYLEELGDDLAELEK